MSETPATSSVSHTRLDVSLVSLPMMAVLVAQFLSALADNALLIAAIAIVKQEGALRLVPVLQEFFVIPFILLAPFVGSIADAWPKGRVMLAANTLKLAGALMMFVGSSPLVAYGVVGVGAAAYSPAKYGILAQLFGPERLVRANGMLEGSTIAAILLGVVLGGWLADVSLNTALGGVAACYTAAAVANLFIPWLPPEHRLQFWSVPRLVTDFAHSAKALFVDRDGRFSLLGTSIFWGSGTTLRLLLFAWVPVALGVANNQTPANLMGVVSIGIVAGATAAGIWVKLETVNRALVAGLLMGPLVLALSHATTLTAAVLWLGVIGFCGGFFVVPLNALLQDRGHAMIGAGRALAVQNFFENGTMLLFVGLYSIATTYAVPAVPTAFGFGIVILVCIGLVAASRMGSSRRDHVRQ
ncbi:MAG TPA: lysophospholipid transporter LplT [Burkholderiales bacterium]|nr:lysophospholipid transporter LplT [Burkholderiales bacterium]